MWVSVYDSYTHRGSTLIKVDLWLVVFMPDIFLNNSGQPFTLLYFIYFAGVLLDNKDTIIC